MNVHESVVQSRSRHRESVEPEDARATSGLIGGQQHGLLMTVEQVAVLWFGEVGRGGSASSNCQKIRRLIPDTLPARRIGNRWYINRATAEAWAAGGDPALVMAHPVTRLFHERGVPPPRKPVGSIARASRPEAVQ